MKYFLALFFITLSLIANAQDDIVSPDVVSPALETEIAPQKADDAYSPNQILEQVAPNFPQEQLPLGFEEPVVIEEPAPIIEPEPIAPELIEGKKATLQILDKIDARVTEVEVEFDKEKEHHGLKIEVKRCVRSPQESKEENMAFMRIWDVGQGDYTNIIFSGWMFSSNPALHSFEHSIYDIVLLKCSD